MKDTTENTASHGVWNISFFGREYQFVITSIAVSIVFFIVLLWICDNLTGSEHMQKQQR